MLSAEEDADGMAASFCSESFYSKQGACAVAHPSTVTFLMLQWQSISQEAFGLVLFHLNIWVHCIITTFEVMTRYSFLVKFMKSLELRNGGQASCEFNLHNKDSKNNKQRWGGKNKQNSTLWHRIGSVWTVTKSCLSPATGAFLAEQHGCHARLGRPFVPG